MLKTPEAAEGSTNTAIVAHDAEDGKTTLATIKAQLALRGHAVHETADGGFLVTRWSLVKHCPDLRCLAAFARAVGAC